MPHGHTLSPHRCAEIVDALRRGTVPKAGLEAFAVGLERFGVVIGEDLEALKLGRGGFKAIRGEYGSGKTFFVRWLQERFRSAGAATAEVQISETETPLHRLETVYRRLAERLTAADGTVGALRATVDGWFYALEQDVMAEGGFDPNDAEALVARTNDLMERRLAAVSRTVPIFAATLRAYRRALMADELPVAEGLIAWLAGQPNVAASVKRAAGVKGDIDHFGALGFLQGLLLILRDAGAPGLVLVLDEVETLQRVRGDVREKGLNALRQLLDEIDAGRFPGLYLVITGTPAFFDGPQGIQRLAPLAQRLHVDFAADPRFDNPRAAQIRLPAFDFDKLCQVGVRVRDVYARQAKAPDRITADADDDLIADLARSLAGRLGNKVGIAPRLFLKKLVAEVLDRIDQFPDFDPRRHYALTLSDVEMTAAERAAAGATDVDDIELPP